MKKLFILFTLFAIKLCAMEQPTTSSIHEAAKRGKLAEVQRWLDRGIDVNKQDNSGWTPLYHAVRYGHQNVVLITHGAHVNHQENGGIFMSITKSGPIYWTTIFSNKNIISLLISYGSNPLIKANQLNALECANHEMKKFIIQEREKYFKSHLPSMLQFLRNRRHGTYTASHESKIGTLFREWQEWEQYKKNHPDIVGFLTQ